MIEPTYTLCANCDHFVEPNEVDYPGVAEYTHLTDDDHPWIDDHDAKPWVGPARTLADWQRSRPDLFRQHSDGHIGPNSEHHPRPTSEAVRSFLHCPQGCHDEDCPDGTD